MNQLLAKPIQLLAIVVAGYVTLNCTFIWAVTNGHKYHKQSLGYINPLVKYFALHLSFKRFIV